MINHESHHLSALSNTILVYTTISSNLHSQVPSNSPHFLFGLPTISSSPNSQRVNCRNHRSDCVTLYFKHSWFSIRFGITPKLLTLVTKPLSFSNLNSYHFTPRSLCLTTLALAVLEHTTFIPFEMLQELFLLPNLLLLQIFAKIFKEVSTQLSCPQRELSCHFI